MSVGFELSLWTLLIAATLTDLVWGKIYNAITFPYFVGGLVVRFAIDGVTSLSIGLIAVGVAFLAFFPLYLLKTWAAGDVKLILAVAAWTNYQFVLSLGIISIVVGAIIGGFLLLRTRGVKDSAKSLGRHLKGKEGIRSLKIPFAPAFLVSFLLLQIAELKGWNLVPFLK